MVHCVSQGYPLPFFMFNRKLSSENHYTYDHASQSKISQQMTAMIKKNYYLLYAMVDDDDDDDDDWID